MKIVLVLLFVMIIFIILLFFLNKATNNKGGDAAIFEIVGIDDDTIKGCSNVLGFYLANSLPVLNAKGEMFMTGNKKPTPQKPTFELNKTFKTIKQIIIINNIPDIVRQPLRYIVNNMKDPNCGLNGKIVLTQLSNGIVDVELLHRKTHLFDFADIISKALFTNNETSNGEIVKRITYLFNKLKELLRQDSNIDFAMFIGQLSRNPTKGNVNPNVNTKFLKDKDKGEIKIKIPQPTNEYGMILTQEIGDEEDEYEDIDDFEFCRGAEEWEDESNEEEEEEEEYELPISVDELKKIIKERRNKKKSETPDPIAHDFHITSLSRPVHQSQNYKYTCQQKGLSSTYKSIDGVIRNWYKGDEDTINDHFVNYQTDANGLIIKDSRSDIASKKKAKGQDISYGTADIYPAEKVIMMILYLSLYDLSPDAPDDLDDLIAVFCLYVQTFNSFCACNMESTWNEKISNEYVYIPNLNVRDESSLVNMEEQFNDANILAPYIEEIMEGKENDYNLVVRKFSENTRKILTRELVNVKVEDPFAFIVNSFQERTGFISPATLSFTNFLANRNTYNLYNAIVEQDIVEIIKESHQQNIEQINECQSYQTNEITKAYNYVMSEIEQLNKWKKTTDTKQYEKRERKYMDFFDKTSRNLNREYETMISEAEAIHEEGLNIPDDQKESLQVLEEIYHQTLDNLKRQYNEAFQELTKGKETIDSKLKKENEEYFAKLEGYHENAKKEIDERKRKTLGNLNTFINTKIAENQNECKKALLNLLQELSKLIPKTNQITNTFTFTQPQTSTLEQVEALIQELKQALGETQNPGQGQVQPSRQTPSITLNEAKLLLDRLAGILEQAPKLVEALRQMNVDQQTIANAQSLMETLILEQSKVQTLTNAIKTSQQSILQSIQHNLEERYKLLEHQSLPKPYFYCAPSVKSPK